MDIKSKCSKEAEMKGHSFKGVTKIKLNMNVGRGSTVGMAGSRRVLLAEELPKRLEESGM